jgi:hypothetical protein
MRLILIGVGVVIVLFFLAALLVGRAVRRASRRIDGWWWHVRELRSNWQPPGPRRDATLLRRRLDTELRATRDMLQHAPQGLVFRADAVALLRELAATATELDTELAGIERFLDPAQQRAALDTVSGQVVQLIETTYAARHTILRTAAEDRSRQLDALRDDVATQATALDNYQRQRRLSL